MKTEEFSGKAETGFNGQALPTPVPFKGSFEAYETYEEMVEAKDGLSNDEELKAVNAKRKNKERTIARDNALVEAGYKKPDADDPAVVRANMIKNILKQFPVLTEAQAGQIVDNSIKQAAAIAPKPAPVSA